MSRMPEVHPFSTRTLALFRLRSAEKSPVSQKSSEFSIKRELSANARNVQLDPKKSVGWKAKIAAWFSKHVIVLLYASVSLALLVLLVFMSFFAATMDDGSEPDFLSCRSWGFGTSCGMWGVDCRPFESEWIAFRCPTRCTLDQSSSLAVYGSGPYRADSRICRAAVHAGVINSDGGCALYRFAGASNTFYSSTTNGITTKEFLSWFPKTIEFKQASSTYCSDLSWWILSVGLIATAGLGLLPGTNPLLMFNVLVVWGFFYTRLIGQPANQNYADITINSFGEVMILLAASSLIYRIAAFRTFRRWKSLQLKQRGLMWTICYVLPFHVMINMNFIGYVSWLNVDLGGYEELHINAGTYIVFTLVGIGVIVIACSLFKSLYHEKVWKKYLVLYALVVATILVTWALFPSTTLHLHHTMLGAFVIPITAFPTPAAAFVQATGLGCFIQGYARWGWNSYLDTIPTYLTIAVPITPPNATNVTSYGATVLWEPLEFVQAYSLRLNSVEVYRGIDTSVVIANLEPNITYFIGVAGIAAWGTDGRVTSNCR